MLYLRIFSCFQKLIPNSCGTNYDLSLFYLATIFKVIHTHFEIFQTVLSLNYKIILPELINLSLIFDKGPNQFSAICSEINTVSNTHLILV